MLLFIFIKGMTLIYVSFTSIHKKVGGNYRYWIINPKLSCCITQTNPYSIFVCQKKGRLFVSIFVVFECFIYIITIMIVETMQVFFTHSIIHVPRSHFLYILRICPKMAATSYPIYFESWTAQVCYRIIMHVASHIYANQVNFFILNFLHKSSILNSNFICC